MRSAVVSLAASCLTLLLSLSPEAAAQSSCVKAGDKCGNNSGFTCCASGNFCQPWEDGYYQCIAVPSGCGTMETDVDYSGDDLESFFGLKLPSDCCDKCKANPQCTSFTFINQWGPACYLKKGIGMKRTLKGAVSGQKIATTTAPPPPPPTTAPPPPSSCAKTGDKCGDNKGYSCCAAGNFCQPWEDGYYQCIPVPSGCGDMETDVDYSGDDLESFIGLKLPSDCCDKCKANPQCTSFTFINQWGPACYLKKGTGTKKTLKGAVSGRRTVATTAPPPAPVCPTKAQASCGNSQAFTCCPSDQYCQPWDAGFYQCIAPATGCGNMETDVDYYGADIANFKVQFPWDCCQKCQENKDCKFFTYQNVADGGPLCYLKSSDAGRRASKGAVSGRKVTATPAPTTPAPPTTCVDIGLACGGSVSCCDTQGAYCHPWAPNDYQCSEKPATCDAGLETDVDYFGNDVGSVSNVDLAECCDACARDANCKAFTFSTTQRACYFKSSTEGRVAATGTLSGKKPSKVIPAPTTPAPAPTTPRPPVTPFPTVPALGNWDTTRCGAQRRNIYYHGNDIAGTEKAFDTVEECCDYCRANPNCKLFTYFRRGNQKRCLLKTGPSTEKTNYANNERVLVASGQLP